MLAPDSRTVALELLRPPAGYSLHFAVLTTYTLDLEAMLALPLGVISRSEQGVEELLADPLLLLEALRQAGERFQVFVDRAGIAVPRTQRELYAMLESSVHPVRAPAGGAFHPKVWVMLFTSEGSPPLLRVAILSRNLTFDRSWDVALASEASPTPGGQIVQSAPLAEFLRRLPDLGVQALHPDISAQVHDLADQVARTAFPAPDGFFDQPVAFHVLGLTEAPRVWRPMSGGYRSLAIAPFVNRTGLEAIAQTAEAERILVSTQEALDQLHPDVLAAWDRVSTLTDAALDEPEDQGSTRPNGLHAKMLAVEHGWDVTWYVGSANLTAAGLTGSNVEVMVEVSARKGRQNGVSGRGIDRFFESGFDTLCLPYRRSPVDPEDPEVIAAQQHLKAAHQALLEADLQVVCRAADDDWTWTLEGAPESVPSDVTVTAWPISVPEALARPIHAPLTWTLPIRRLTSLVAFRLHVPLEAVDDLVLALKLPAKGMPSDRMHHVLVSLIDNRQRFLAFLRALLGGLEGMADWSQDANGAEADSSWDFGIGEGSLLEDLVRAASRDPKRLDPVRRLIADFRTSEQGRQIVPDDLHALWTAVDNALHKDGPA